MTQQPEHSTIPQFTVADRLRKARETAGYSTQLDFEAATGISRGTINTHEAGRRQPSRRLLIEWAMHTGVPVEWLETGAATRREHPGGPPGGPPRDGRAAPRWDAGRE